VRDISIEKVLDDDTSSETAQSKLVYSKIMAYKQKIKGIESNILQIKAASDAKKEVIRKLSEEYSMNLNMAKKYRIDVEEAEDRDSGNKAQYEKLKRAYGLTMKVSQQNVGALSKKEQELMKTLKASEKKRKELEYKIDRLDKEMKDISKEMDSSDYSIDTDRSNRSLSLKLKRNPNMFTLGNNQKQLPAPPDHFRRVPRFITHSNSPEPKLFLRSVENSPNKHFNLLKYRTQPNRVRKPEISSKKSFKKELKSFTPTQLKDSTSIPESLSLFFLRMERTTDLKSLSRKKLGIEQDFMSPRQDGKLPQIELSYESPVKHGKQNNMDSLKLTTNLPIIVEVDNFQFSGETFQKDEES
jgi:hypothetical protein